MIKSNSPGFLTLEILLCLAIGAAAITAALSLVFANQAVVIDVQNQRLALEKSRQIIEAASAQEFAHQVEAPAKQVLLLADYAKLVSANHTWANQGLEKSSSLFSLSVDWRQALGRDTCALAFSGDWTQPRLVGGVAFGADNPATAVDVNFKQAYVTTNSSVTSKADFFIVDVTKPSAPSILSSLNTGPGLNDVHVAGDYAFAANTSLNSQLQIIKIRGQPTLMLNLKLPLGNDGLGSSLYYYNQKLFVGVIKSAGPELFIYDVADPLAPRLLGAYETNTAVNGIYVDNGLAYLALAQGKLLTILNVSDPANIVEMGSFTPTGENVQSAQSLTVLGNHIVLGRAGGLPQLGYKEFYWLDAAKVNGPMVKAELDLNASVHGIFLRNGLIFSAVRQIGSEFKVFALSADLPLQASLSLPHLPTSLDCESQNFYLTVDFEPQLQIVSPN